MRLTGAMTEASPTVPSTADELALADRLQRLADRRAQAAPPATAGPAPVRSRRHPAKAARYAAAGMSLLSTAGLTSLFVGEASGASQSSGAASLVTTASPSAAASGSSSAAQSAPTGVETVVDGAVFHNKWGDVQVEATFAADGTLTTVTALETPGGKSRSIEINRAAVPRLNADAVAIQSADVHTVSGATYTSDSYRLSLQSAIDAAHAANATTVQ